MTSFQPGGTINNAMGIQITGVTMEGGLLNSPHCRHIAFVITASGAVITVPVVIGRIVGQHEVFYVLDAQGNRANVEVVTDARARLKISFEHC